MNELFYGDNLDILHSGKIPDNSVDLCYIDPPFNSKRNYNQIYNRVGEEDLAQAEAFIDTWIWDDQAKRGYDEIIQNAGGRFTPQLVELVKGLRQVLGGDSLLAYIVSMALRVTEIQRVLKPNGTFYLHCDPTAGHYLKLVLDAVFIPNGGKYRNEIVWCYAGGGIPKRDFPRKHDTIFRYSKGKDVQYKPEYREYTPGTVQRGRTAIKGKYFKQGLRKEGTPVNDWWADIPKITSPDDPEKLGYPTQKSKALLKRIIDCSSEPGDTVLDAYCGCGTTVEVAQELGRRWIGIDITYQSISLILYRLEKAFPRNFKDILANIRMDGVPRDMASAQALSLKADDRVRKEFEKWAVLTFTNNHGRISDKKGADRGIDGFAYSQVSSDDNAKIILQVKSGHVNRSTIATLRGDMARENAAMAVLITLEEPTREMKREASDAGHYRHPLMGRDYPAIRIVTVQDILEKNARLDVPLSVNTTKSASAVALDDQINLF
ncbi:MAG: DNA methyltransferase [Candidatus Cybelea sp.]